MAEIQNQLLRWMISRVQKQGANSSNPPEENQYTPRGIASGMQADAAGVKGYVNQQLRKVAIQKSKTKKTKKDKPKPEEKTDEGGVIEEQSPIEELLPSEQDEVVA